MIESRDRHRHPGGEDHHHREIVMLPLVLRQERIRATTIKGWGARGEVNIIFTIVRARRWSR